LDRIETRSGPRAEWLNEDELQHLCRQGLLSLNDDHLALTYDGKAVMNTVIGRLLT
jgi:coproporphyrinogen III oxidase-like Fe-S oxidoreductase